MLRWLFRILASLSAVLCLACISLWLRSYWVQDGLRRLDYSFPPATARLNWLQIVSARGGIYVDHRAIENDIEGSNDDHQMYLRQNGWEHSRVYLFASARENFIAQGGRAYFGFGCKKTIWIEPSGSRYHPRPNSQIIHRLILLPWAVPVLAFAVLPALLLRSILRSRRKRIRLARNLCPTCGYDLRGSPEKCPECGESSFPARS